MRVQYTKAEHEIINKRRDIHQNFDGIIVPVEGQGQQITMGLLITDVHRFNMFVTNWLNDQGKKDSEIAKEIGADIVHIDYRAPIKSDQLLFIKNYIEGMLYGPEVAAAMNGESSISKEGEDQAIPEEDESIKLVSPQTESGLIVDDSISPIAKSEDSTLE